MNEKMGKNGARTEENSNHFFFFTDNIFPYFRTDRLSLKPFQLGAVVVINDTFGSWSLLSHSKEMERADRPIMKLSLVLTSVQPITWRQGWYLSACTSKGLRKRAKISGQAGLSNGSSCAFPQNPKEDWRHSVMTLRQAYLPRGGVAGIVNTTGTVRTEARPLGLTRMF